MKNLATFLATLALLLAIAPQAVLADSRCSNSRPGIQVWQDDHHGGPSMILCTSLYGPWTGWPNLGNYTTNLNFFANWNDRITSVQTFNNAGHKFILYVDTNFSSASENGRTVTLVGNDNIANLGNFWSDPMRGGFNDVTSSIWFAP